MNPVKTQHGYFYQNVFNVWVYRCNAGVDVFEACNDAAEFYRGFNDGFAAWFYFNQVPCPMTPFMQGMDLWRMWESWERAWDFDQAPTNHLKDLIATMLQP